LYNDETIRPAEKVTGIVSGMRIAGKEFGLGMYDGVSGLVTQPWKAMEKEGGKGLWKGVGKGIGGLVLKPASAIWAIPAYTMQGVNAEVRNIFARSSTNYIIASRVQQGEGDLGGSTPEERRDILARWRTIQDDLKGFYSLQQKEGEKARAATASQQDEQRSSAGRSVGGTFDGGSSSSGTMWSKLQKSAWKRGQAWANAGADTGAGTAPPTTASSGSSSYSFEDNGSMERAIQQSIVQTSTGDREEDARIEAAVRASVMEMRKVAEQQEGQGQGQGGQGVGGWGRDLKTPVAAASDAGAQWGGDQKMATGAVNDAGAQWGGEKGVSDEEWTNVTDEEYQALIEEAVKQSLLQQEMELVQRGDLGYHQHQQQQQQQQWGGDSKGDKKQTEAGREPVVDELPPYAVHELPGDLPSRAVGDHGDGGVEDEDEQLRRVMEASEREHRDREQLDERQRTEEDIVFEYVKKQSLAEEEYRRAKAAGKGKAASGPGEGDGGGDE
jgi:hypothetical protein